MALLDLGRGVPPVPLGRFLPGLEVGGEHDQKRHVGHLRLTARSAAWAARKENTPDRDHGGRRGRAKGGRWRCAVSVNRSAVAGLAKPYHRLTKKPDHVPQSCIQHWLKAGVRKGGGRRRRTG